MMFIKPNILRLWDEYHVQTVVLLSLVFQIILIVLGNRRKLTDRAWIRIIVWSTYLSADWVAIVALGNLASSVGDSCEGDSVYPTGVLHNLLPFWAPFLLLHLGGPDTITAYSLEDNELLWLRHLVGLLIQVGVTFYVVLRSWDNSALAFLTIPIFISGVIKYGERTYALWYSSSGHFKDFLPSSIEKSGESEEEMGIHMADHYLVLAYYLFTRTKVIFAEGTLNKDEQKRIYSIIKNKPTAEAFILVAIELDFMYDVLYTKAAIVYSHLGIILRCITFFSSVCVLVVFSTTIVTVNYPPTVISITYSLLVGTVLIELYAFILLFLSNWTKLWLIKLKKAQHNPISKPFVDLLSRFFVHSQSLLTNRTKSWSESMGQYSIISSSLKKVQPACIQVQKLPLIGEWLENKYLTRVDGGIIDILQEKILEYLREQGRIIDTNDKSYIKRRDSILGRRGNFALRKRYNFGKLESQWCATKVEFVDSLIMWHIATDICFNDDHDDNDLDCKISKCLSDYMMYILVFHPSMLPEEIDEINFKENNVEIRGKISAIRFKETSDEIIQLLKKNKLHDPHSTSKACEALLQNYPDLLQKFDDWLQNDERGAADFNEFFKGESRSLLKYGLMLSKQLHNEHGRKWKIISDVWIEMLLYAAHNCGWEEHAQQLRKGGELLTHVCLLMAHFGLTKQYVTTRLFRFTPEVDKLESESD